MSLSELSVVRLTRQVANIPAGSVGTIVYVYPYATIYEVEFTIGDTFDNHWHPVETVRAEDLEAVT